MVYMALKKEEQFRKDELCKMCVRCKANMSKYLKPPNQKAQGTNSPGNLRTAAQCKK